MAEVRALAEAGHPQAQFEIAQKFAGGERQGTRCVGNDEKQAVEWYRRSAEQGFALAQYWLGLHVLLGVGLPEDESEAVNLFRKAAPKDTHARFLLFFCLKFGLGVAQNLSEAMEMCRGAAAGGLSCAQEALKRPELAIEFFCDSIRNIPDRNEDAFSILRAPLVLKLAAKGDPVSQCLAAMLFNEGKGVEKSADEAVRYLRRAVDVNIPPRNLAYRLGC